MFIFKKNEQQLKFNLVKEKISEFQNIVIKEICSDLPIAFWNRKQYIVDLMRKIFLLKLDRFK